MPRPPLLLLAASMISVGVRADDAPVATPVAPAIPATSVVAPKADATDSDESVVAPKKTGAEKEITSAELDALIARLSQLRGGLDAETRRAIAETLKALNAAIVDNAQASALFIATTRAVEFDKQDKTAADFDTWRKQNDDRNHDGGFASALRIQYRYLKLCLECDTSEKATAAFPAIFALQEDAIKVLASSGQYSNVLKEDVFGDTVSRRYNVTKLKPEGWSGSALDLEGHFKRAIKVALETKPEAVPQIWDARLRLERALAEATDKNNLSTKRKKTAPAQGQNQGKHGPHPRSPSDPDTSTDDTKSVADYETVKLPRLLWAMAEDYLKAGMHRRGFMTMFNIIMKYPKHPDVGTWVDRISELADVLKSGGDPGQLEAKAPDAPDAPKRDSSRKSSRRGA